MSLQNDSKTRKVFVSDSKGFEQTTECECNLKKYKLEQYFLVRAPLNDQFHEELID